MMKRLIAFAAAAPTTLAVALAQPLGRPHDGGIALQPAGSPVAHDVHFFHNFILFPIITAISLLVLGLLVWIVLRFNSKAHPTPSKFSHNTLIEVIWTGVPILILLAIALPSFELLFKEDVMPDGKTATYKADGVAKTFVLKTDLTGDRKITKAKYVNVYLEGPSGERTRVSQDAYSLDGLGTPEIKATLNSAPPRGDKVVVTGGRYLDRDGSVVTSPQVNIKAIGFQWGWSYAYPDFGDFEFVSNLKPKEELEDKSLYLLETDNHIIVPVGETVRILTTSRDVIHAWAMPAFAVKVDAVPGRLNETWFRADKEGLYYGQCSELCGLNHAFMPITVEVVSQQKFCEWIAEQQADSGIELTDEQRAKEPLCGTPADAMTVAQAGTDAQAGAR